MANQIIIDIGAAANDGTGDPLRTAFNYVNNNFSNVWNTGLPNSNVQFSDNRILTVNTNANLVLAPNGIGKVASNVDIVPNTANVFSLGGTARRWNTVYGQYLNLSHNATIGGNLVVTGNLTAGNISYTSNVFVGDLEGSVFDGASSIVLDVIDSAIYVDNYYYANGAPFSGGGSNYGNSNVAAYLVSYTGNISAGNASIINSISSHDVYADTGSFSGDPVTGDAALYVGAPNFVSLGSDVMAQFTGNITNYGQINFQNYSNAATASGDYIVTSDNGTDSSHFVNLGITSSTWNGTQQNSLGNALGPGDGYLYAQDGNMVIAAKVGNATGNVWKFDTTGNLTVPKDIIPTGNNTQSLGSATKQWNDLYLSNATIYMNSVPISLTSGNVLTVNGADVVTTAANGESSIGNLDILGTTISIAAGAPETYLDLSASVQGFAYVQVPNDATANISNVRIHNDAGNIEFGTDAGNNLWYFSNAGTLTVPGPITSAVDTEITATDDVVIYGGDKVPGGGEGGDVFIDGGNGADDNGSSVSGGGDIELTGGAGGDALDIGSGTGGFVRLVGGDGGTANSGNSIQAGEGGQIVILGGSAGDNNGNLSLNGLGGNVEIYGGSGSFDVANSRPDGPAGHVNLYGGNWGFNFVPTGNIYLNTYDGTNFKTLTYDNVGNVTMAPGGALNFVGSNPGIVQSPDEDFRIRVQDADDDGFALLLQVDDGAGTVLGSTELQRDRFVVQFAGGGAPQFTFNENGEFSVPGNIRATEYVDTSLYSVSNEGGAGTVELKVISYTGDVLGSNVRVTQSNATISTGNAQHTWLFDNTGNLTVPGNSIVSTANATGNVAGKSINIRAGAADQTDYYATAGGNLNLIGGLGASNDGGGGGPGGAVNITSGLSADPAGHAGNVTINAGSNTWTFDYNGYTQFPNSTITDPGTVNQINLNDSGGIKISTFDTNDIVIETDVDGGDGGTWTFYNDGRFGPGLEGQDNDSIYLTGRGATGSSYLRWNNNQANVSLPSDTYITAGNGVANISILNSGVGGFTQSWIFDATGNLTVPGNIVMPPGSSLVGNGASPAPSISGFSNGEFGGNVSVTGNISGGNISISTGGNISGNTAGYAIGYRDIPQITLGANVTANATNAGRHFYSTTAGNLQITLPDNANVAFPLGATLTVVVNAAGNVIVAQGTGVSLYMAGSSSTGNRTVGAYGLASVMKVATDTWVISGTGVY